MNFIETQLGNRLRDIRAENKRLGKRVVNAVGVSKNLREQLRRSRLRVADLETALADAAKREAALSSRLEEAGKPEPCDSCELWRRRSALLACKCEELRSRVGAS